MASGVNSTFRQVGIATGIAGLGAIFQSAVTTKIVDALGPGGAGAKLPPSEVLAQGNPKVAGPAREAFITGWTGALNEILIVAAVLALAGAVAALLLVRSQDFVPHGGAPAATSGG
jgi:hypothetical protein